VQQQSLARWQADDESNLVVTVSMARSPCCRAVDAAGVDHNRSEPALDRDHGTRVLVVSPACTRRCGQYVWTRGTRCGSCDSKRCQSEAPLADVSALKLEPM